MTQHVRKSYRNHRKATWAAVLVVLIAAALAIVLPALGQSTTPATGVAPPSHQGVYPSIVNLGGSNFSCASAGATSYGGTPTPSGMRQFQISKPTPGSYTDPATGVTFDVSGPTGLQDRTSFFSFRVRGNAAVVYHVSVKGGTKIAWYDYYNNNPSSPALPGGGVYSDDNVHSTPDSKYTASNWTFYVASITTFCYRPLTVTPSCTSPFSGVGFGGGVEYSAQLTPNNGVCKNSNVVMYTYNNNGTLFATLHPATATEGATYKVVEHIHWRGFGALQNPVKLWYQDTPPYDGSSKTEMLLCKTDPRPNPTSNPFTLPSTVTDSAVLPTGHTSCMLESTDSAPASGDADTSREWDAWIYSNVDGGRGPY